MDEPRSPYAWMALAAFALIVIGKTLLPFPGQQQAQNLSLAIEGVVGATLGFGVFRLSKSRRRAG